MPVSKLYYDKEIRKYCIFNSPHLNLGIFHGNTMQIPSVILNLSSYSGDLKKTHQDQETFHFWTFKIYIWLFFQGNAIQIPPVLAI